jgi:hypothetical protein
MKNIHLLPIDKPSRIRLGNNGNFVIANFEQSSIRSKNDSYTNQHIYITSDEEIKEGDWVVKISSLYKGGGNVQKYSFIDTQFEDITFKKIILTTDQDLIKDSVQAIDDEFLEWFVKNPSCEEVEVEIETTSIQLPQQQLSENSYDLAFRWINKKVYKIIIPQEEPK